MTEKLYYRDAYIESFTATVLSCEPCEGGFDTVLDKTAFFPEEGGQYSDKGTLGGIKVFDVKEKGGVIHHYTAEPLSAASTVEGKIDFEERLEKMQCHTAEHILSGLFHSLFGLENVGFHLGAEDVTMDISAPLERAELYRVEALANSVVLQNIPVVASFPTAQELLGMKYRSKLDLTENVRIVKIGDTDSCACCAPHVKQTGEVGLIKILDFQKLRGGMRLHITAGARAYRMIASLYSNIQRISELLSVPRAESAEGVERLLSELAASRDALKSYRLSDIERRAKQMPDVCGNALIRIDGASIPELIAFSNTAAPRVSGILVLLSGCDGDFKYVISSNTVDLRANAPDINKSLLGRGGGRSNMLQGSFGVTYDKIAEYFSPSHQA